MYEDKYKNPEDVLRKGKEILGIPLKNLDKHERLLSGKGGIGHMIEESVFEYKINSDSAPDFKEAGVELKVTPYIKLDNKIRAKERLVLNIINYEKEYLNTFETSSLWTKNKKLLLMFYEHINGVSKGDFIINEAILYTYPLEDLIIIKQDWEKIINKIRDGKAHEISEGDTLYLGACTKGSTALKSLRTQPFSDIKAKQRAYSLKQSYMTYILNTYIFGARKNENIVKDLEELESTNFEVYLINKINPYLGRTQESLKEEFGIPGYPKNINEIIISKILGISGKISNTEEFIKADIIPKTIRINEDDTITESMSFPNFKFKEIILEAWEDSDFKQYLGQKKFLFIIFKYRGKLLVLKKVMFWNIPDRDLLEVQKVWEKTVEIIKEGVELTRSGNMTINNFPKSKDNSVAHVRPHAQKASDTYELPDGRFMTKQCFWLNNSYIKSQIEENTN